MFLSAAKNLWPTALVHGQRSFRIHGPEFMLCHCGKFIWSIYPLVARGIFKDNDSVVPGYVAEVEALIVTNIFKNWSSVVVRGKLYSASSIALPCLL